jgi:hypothetical protein
MIERVIRAAGFDKFRYLDGINTLMHMPERLYADSTFEWASHRLPEVPTRFPIEHTFLNEAEAECSIPGAAPIQFIAEVGRLAWGLDEETWNNLDPAHGSSLSAALLHLYEDSIRSAVRRLQNNGFLEQQTARGLMEYAASAAALTASMHNKDLRVVLGHLVQYVGATNR